MDHKSFSSHASFQPGDSLGLEEIRDLTGRLLGVTIQRLAATGTPMNVILDVTQTFIEEQNLVLADYNFK